MPLRIAHRGMPRRLPENALPGFALALELGADGLELDVHATRDGIVVVHHDPVLRDGRAIAELDHADLRRVEVAPGVAVPTLGDVCELVAGRAELLVEIKGAGIERQVLAALAGYRGEAAIHSFDHPMIGRLQEGGCPWRLGVLVEDAGLDVRRLARETGARDVWPHHSIVTPAFARMAAEDPALRVIVWTVNDPAMAVRLAAQGVDGLCGDDVTLLPGRPLGG